MGVAEVEETRKSLRKRLPFKVFKMKLREEDVPILADTKSGHFVNVTAV